jgi:hypothetical protein
MSGQMPPDETGGAGDSYGADQFFDAVPTRTSSTLARALAADYLINSINSGFT